MRCSPCPALVRSALLIACGLAQTTPAFELRSPNGQVHLTVTAGDALTWSVAAHGHEILKPSKLGMELFDGPFPAGPLRIVREHVRTINTTWQWDFGARSKVKDHGREAALTLQETRPGGRTFSLVLRAYDDGAAIRYAFPADFAVDVLKVKAERTEFVVAKDFHSWVGDHKTNYGHQECEYPPGSLARITPESFVTAPIVMKIGDDQYAALAEAALLNWAGMYFAGAKSLPLLGGKNPYAGPVTLVSKLSTRPEGDARFAVEAPLPCRTPWRVVMVGRSPGDLVESDLLLNLNVPSRISDTSWIKPGMCAWDHWWSGEQRMETAAIKEYIDLAADMRWPYQLVDWWWYGDPEAPDASVFNSNPKLDMAEVRRYAAEKGVKLWVWVRWNHLEDVDVCKRLFAQLEDWGVAGVKIDFMQRDDQAMVNWYENIVKLAADHRLMVDFHGAYKPTGEQRTWPNLITREGVKGNEFNKWSHEVTPTHRATLPFTRMLMGPMDFTPGGFLNRQPSQHQTNQPAAQVQGTRAQELSLFVAYLSPFMCVCDHPTNILGQPGADFLKVVPTVWDDTRVLAGEIGEYAVIARRSGERWFVGGLTNEQPRELEIDFARLGAGPWRARLWEDGAKAAEDATDLSHRQLELGEGEKPTIKLAPAGGFALVLDQVED